MRKSGKATESNSVLGDLIAKGLELLSTFGLMASEAKEALSRKTEAVFWRTVLLLTLVLWMSAGLFLLILGCMQLLIDQAGWSRGAVYSVGGLLVFLIAALGFQGLRLRQSRPRH